MRTTKIFLFYLLFFNISVLHAAQSDSTLSYNVQAVQFRINDSLNLAEIYFGIPRSSLNFVEQGTGLIADFEMTVQIMKAGRELAQQSWRSSSTANSVEEISASQTLFSMTKFQMKAGSYFIKTTVTDLHGQKKGTENFDLKIKPYSTQSLAISEIELAASLKRDTSPGRFNKNGYQIIPNPSALYGDGLPLLRFYAEIYNLQFPSDTTYTVSYHILDSQNQPVKIFPVKEKMIAGTSLVEAGGFNVISIPSGSYRFVLEVKDNGSGAVARQESKFFVFRLRDQAISRARPNAEAIVEAMAYLYRDKTEKEIDREFDAARWLANREETMIYEGLDFEGKKNFLIRFWYARDSDTTTVINEFRDDYLKRVRYATESFGGLKDGWRTDRGRVLLIYGSPDEIENFPSSNDSRAYQVWNYFSIEGGVKFYFVDIRGWGEYQQVNSTARNELADPDWQRWLRPSR
jgi:GWxTD domain-containing protein